MTFNLTDILGFSSVNVRPAGGHRLLHVPQSTKISRTTETIDAMIEKSNISHQGTARWIVHAAKPVPVFPLEISSVYIHFDATIVASRIDEMLRVRSVQVTFDSKNAEATCKTGNFLEYKINLFAGDDGVSTHVEIIRIHGCGFAMKAEREAIINAAKGLGAISGTTRSAPKLVLSIPDELKSLYKPPSRTEIESTLERACDYFHSNNRHNVLFALENLAAITNANKANTETAHQMSQLIMQNECDARDFILAIYFAKDQNESSCCVNDQIKHSCLTIILQGLEYLSSKQSGFLDETYDQFVGKLMPQLIEDVRECKCSRIHNSCLALQCLYLILSNSSRARQSAEDYNMRDIIMQAEQYGRREHLNLEQIAKSTIGLLNVN